MHRAGESSSSSKRERGPEKRAANRPEKNHYSLAAGLRCARRYIDREIEISSAPNVRVDVARRNGGTAWSIRWKEIFRAMPMLAT